MQNTQFAPHQEDRFIWMWTSDQQYSASYQIKRHPPTLQILRMVSAPRLLLDFAQAETAWITEQRTVCALLSSTRNNPSPAAHLCVQQSMIQAPTSCWVPFSYSKAGMPPCRLVDRITKACSQRSAQGVRRLRHPNLLADLEGAKRKGVRSMSFPGRPGYQWHLGNWQGLGLRGLC
jgi:hypothetical protein